MCKVTTKPILIHPFTTNCIKETSMKAITYSEYGPPSVLHLTEIPKPKPKANEVLIRIHASTVTSGDWRARSLILPPGFGILGRLVFGIFGPRQPILGSELAGVIEAIGPAVTHFKVGDEVFAFTGAKMGCNAEYRTLPETAPIAIKPKNLSFEEAAALSFGGTTALDFLRDKGQVKRGEKVLIIGASGCVGSAAVQIAKYFGAEVTGVCSTSNVDLVRSVGADHIIDYTKEAFIRNGKTYDIIMNVNGAISFAQCEKSLNPGGRLLLVLGSFSQAMGREKPSKESGKKVIAGVAAERLADLQLLAQLAENGAFKPVIDRSYPLAQTADAHAHVDTGRKKGNVTITMPIH
jgi:NADPH:quinone reductase-like Zn-dependent oxidoreductase